MHRSSVLRSLPLLAIIVGQVHAQFPGPPEAFVPAVCVPSCTIWSDTATACQTGVDFDLACICKQPNFDVFVQCGLCSADPANPLPPGIPESDRIDVGFLQATYDAGKATCDEGGYDIDAVNLATATYTVGPISSTSTSRPVTTSTTTSKPPSTPTTSKPPSKNSNTSDPPPTNSPTNNPTNTGGSPASHTVPMLSLGGLVAAIIPVLLL